MGCDIHMYVEYKAKQKEVDTWFSGDYFKPNRYYDGKNDDESKFERIELHGSRNYSLFSTLAGVRDYTESMIPVSEEKGMPDDCCQYVKDQYEIWDGDGHTHSWLTLKELKDHQKTNPILKHKGLVHPQFLKAFDESGTIPEWWCQGTSESNYEWREWETENTTLVPLIEKLQKRAHELLQYDWQDYKEENDEKVRIVFWFDN